MSMAICSKRVCYHWEKDQGDQSADCPGLQIDDTQDRTHNNGAPANERLPSNTAKSAGPWPCQRPDMQPWEDHEPSAFRLW